MRRGFLLVLVGMFVIAMFGAAHPVSAASGKLTTYPDWTSGNAIFECNSIDFPYGTKLDGNPNSGTYQLDGGAGSVTITWTDANKSILNWSATIGIDAVILKAGNGANIYTYDPEEKNDTGLATPNGKNISHLTFCYDYELTASKTAGTSYTRTYSWDITKSANLTTHIGAAGDTFSSAYDVVVNQTVADSNFAVSGNIVVSNPTPYTVSFGVTDSVGGNAAQISCPDKSLAPGASTTCTYSVNLTSKANGTNTATINSLNDKVGSATASANYTFGAPTTVVGDPTINVTDSVEGSLGSASGDKTFTYTTAFSCSSKPSDYTNGADSDTYPNTATIVETKQSSNASVTVNCALPALTAEKTAEGSFDRTITWSLSKSVDPASHSGQAGASFQSIWTVTATKNVVEDNHTVTGDIIIANPAAIAQTFEVSDILDDGTKADVTCPTNTVPAKDSVTCTYTANTANAAENVATVSAPGNNDVEAKALVTYTAKVSGDETVTLSDAGFDNYSEEINNTTTKTFQETFTCSSNAADYTNGSLTETYNNTANLTGPNTNKEATASVKVTCQKPEVWKGETATGQGSRYPGSSNWFMYTGYTTSKVDLIAGQRYDAGDIFMSRSGANTIIQIKLHSGFRFANVKENLKIQDFTAAPKSYIQPGAFKYKWTITGNSAKVTIPGTTAQFYGIHADVERLLQ